MIVFRRRLIYWILKEYFRKLGKRIFFFFILGVTVFFLLENLYKTNFFKIPFAQRETIGIVGAYSLNNLPNFIHSDISSGLTNVSDDGTIKSGIASFWKISDSGKTYTFRLRNDLRFTDGTDLSSETVNYNFSDVKVSKISKYILVFKLKDPFAPFLTSVSRPVFRNGFIGTGKYRIKDIKLNGNFIDTLVLSLNEDSAVTKVYQFYPSTDALKLAFALGEIKKAIGLTDTNFKNLPFSSFPNVSIEKKTNYNQLVTLFFNTRDSILSEKRIRNALSYSIPEEFDNGQRAFLPFSHIKWARSDQYAHREDFDHAKLLISTSSIASKSATLNLKMKTFPKYSSTAQKIADSWRKIGIKTKIEIVDSIPNDYQIFLGDFHVSKDPDQYSLWHSDQENNITHYKNMRIDKLLEDGRKTVDQKLRKKIYQDFQKYLIDDSPAVFIYFPYEYTVKKK